MKETMKKFGAWLIAAALAFAGTAAMADDVQQPTQIADWFSAGFDGTDTQWTIPTDAAEFESGKILIDTADGEEVVYAPAVIGKSSDKVSVKTAVEMTPVKALPDASSLDGAQAAFTVLKEGEELAYYGLAKVNDAATWVKLTNATPVEDAEATVTIEFDYSSAKTVTYKVGETVLSDGTTTALPLADATKTTVSSIAYTGSGVASLLAGDYRDADRKFAVANAQAAGGYVYFATELAAQNAAGEGGAYLAFSSTGGGWEAKTAPAKVAEIVETSARFSSFADAVQAVADGQTIKLLDDLTISASEVGSSSRIRARQNVNYTLQGEGHTITLEPDNDYYYFDRTDASIVFDNVRIVGDKDKSLLALYSSKLTNHSLVDAAQLYTMTGIVSVDATSCMIDRTHEFHMNSTLIVKGDEAFDPAVATQAEKNEAAQMYAKTIDIRDNKTFALTNANITMEQRFQSNAVNTGADLFASNSLIEIGRSVENVSEGFPLGTWCPNAIANERGDLTFTAKQRAELSDCVLRGARNFNNAGLFVAKNTFIEFGNDFTNTGDLTLDGSEVNVGTDFTGPASSGYTGKFVNNGTIFLKNCSTISFANQGASSGRMVIQGSTLEYADVNIAAGEEIALDAASKITFTGTWSNAGNVTFNMTDATEEQYLLVENKGEAVVDDYGITLTGEGYELKIVEGNLCAVKTAESPYWSDHAAAEYSTPVDTVNKILTIATPEELALFAKEVNEKINSYNNYTITITKDIDLSAYEWVSIIALDEGSPYYDALQNAVIEGNGNTISGMTINKDKEDEETAKRLGFIGYYAGELTVKNLTFDGAKVTACCQSGIVIGSMFSNTVIENVHVVNSVMDASYYFAPIVGFMNGNGGATVTIKDCTCENVKVTDDYNGKYNGLMVGLIQNDDAVVFENSKIKNDCIANGCKEFVGYSYTGATNPAVPKMSEVDGWWYPTLADGIEAVEEDGEIVLLANCAEEVTTVRTAGFTLRLADGVKFTGKVTGPEGYALKDNGDGTYTYGEAAADVCQIGETKYPSIAKALEAIGATESKTGAIKMIDNSTMAGNFGVTIPDGYDVTLDLNGFRISNDAHEKSNSATIQVEQGAKLKITDSVGTGVVANTVEPGTNGSWSGRNWWSDVIINYGTLVLDSGTVTNTTEDLSYAVDSQRDATFIMNGGKLYSDKGDTAVRMVANSGSSLFRLGYNRFEMHGGEIVSGGLWLQQGDNPSEWPDICRNNGAVVIVDSGTINGFFDVQNMGSVTVDVSGGVINASKLRIRDSYLSEAKYFTISGGKISATAVDDQVTGGKLPVSITGGLFDETAKTGLEKYVAEGHAFVENTDPETSADYPWMVGEVSPYEAAVISADGTVTNKYETLAAAIAAVNVGETIQMLANVTLDKVLDIPADKSFTLDLNGKKISNAATGFDWTATNVPTGTPVRMMIILRGTMTVCDTSEDADGSIWTDNYSYKTTKAMLVANNGCLTLESGTIHGEYAGIYVVGDTSLSQSGAKVIPTLTLNGGVVSGDYGACAKGETAMITVNDGATLRSVNGFALGTNGTQDWYNGGNCRLVVNGGLLESTAGSAVYNPAECIFEIKGGMFKGVDTAVSVKGGQVTISGGTLIATGPAKDPEATSSDATATGDALYIEDTYANHKPIVKVTGGSFKSANNLAVRYFTNKADGATDHGSLTLTGGIYSTEPDATYIAEGYKAENNPDEETKEAYPWKVQEPTVKEPIVIDIAEKPEAGEPDVKVPVTVTQELAKEILGKDVDVTQPLDEAQVTEIVTQLETKGEDGMTGWQKYTAGFSQTDKHPLAPKGVGGENGQLVLVTSLVPPKHLSVDTGVKVKYILMKGTGVDAATGLPTRWEKFGEPLDTPEFPVAVAGLDPETYWKIEVEYTATKTVETEVEVEE